MDSKTLAFLNTFGIVGDNVWGFASVLAICVTAIILQIMKGARKKE